MPRRDLESPTIPPAAKPKLSQNELELVNLKRPSNAYHLWVLTVNVTWSRCHVFVTRKLLVVGVLAHSKAFLYIPIICLQQITRGNPFNDVNHSAAWNSLGRCHKRQQRHNSEVFLRQISISVSNQQGMYRGKIILIMGLHVVEDRRWLMMIAINFLIVRFTMFAIK